MRPVIALGLVGIALFFQGCLFGSGGEEDAEPTATSDAAAPTETETPESDDETATAAASSSTATATTASQDPDTPTPDLSSPTVYTVLPGDFLSVIAAKFGITVEALAAANGIDDPDKIYVGQELTIPAAE